MQEIIPMIADRAFEFLAAVAVIIVTYIVVPWLKQHRIYDVIEKFVEAAEKLNESGQLGDTTKLEYVTGLLEENGYKITNTIRAYIESAVKRLDIESDLLPAGIEPAVEVKGELEAGIDVDEAITAIGEMISDAVVKAVQGAQDALGPSDGSKDAGGQDHAAAGAQAPEEAETEAQA